MKKFLLALIAGAIYSASAAASAPEPLDAVTYRLVFDSKGEGIRRYTLSTVPEVPAFVTDFTSQSVVVAIDSVRGVVSTETGELKSGIEASVTPGLRGRYGAQESTVTYAVWKNGATIARGKHVVDLSDRYSVDLPGFEGLRVTITQLN